MVLPCSTYSALVFGCSWDSHHHTFLASSAEDVWEEANLRRWTTPSWDDGPAQSSVLAHTAQTGMDQRLGLNKCNSDDAWQHMAIPCIMMFEHRHFQNQWSLAILIKMSMGRVYWFLMFALQTRLFRKSLHSGRCAAGSFGTFSDP